MSIHIIGVNKIVEAAMIIHVVQSGETIFTIAEKYGVTASKLIQDNGLVSPGNLVVGQTIVIVYPQQTYTVMEGDSLQSVADAHGITLIQLLRNNPFLSDREFIYPGETLVISYNNNNGKISVLGYANPFIDRTVLTKTLPYLTYLAIFGHRIIENAEIVSVDDAELIQTAKDYGVAPIMFLSTLTAQGVSSLEAAYSILLNSQLTDRFINNILNLLNSKGYYGLNLTYQFLSSYSLQAYNEFTTKLVDRLNSAGYPVFITLTPIPVYNVNETTFERIDYSYIGQKVNKFIIMSFNFGYSYGPPAPIVSLSFMRGFLDYAVSQIPPEKILVGLPELGYDWQLPYVAGISKANSLTIDSAIALAGEVDSHIQFDDTSQTPFFQYIDYSSGIPKQHVVWFIDSRTVDSTARLIPEYGIYGIAIWNIMNYFTQLWLILNSQYEIERIL